MNSLTHLEEFRTLLADYKLSKKSLLTLSQTKLVLLAAPTSSGRNTIIRQLMKTGDYYFVISDTTRQPRINDGVPEQNGVEYWFRDEEAVLEDIKQGKYLEAAVIHNQQVSGISVRELQNATDAGKIAVTDAEIAGVDNAIKYKADTLGIFVLPPSFEEWQRRLRHRGEMDSEEYKRRMESAVKEFEAALEHDYYKFVINSSVEEAAEQVNTLAKLDEVDSALQARGRELAEQLVVETNSLLNTLN
jgi:guanylate kinase